MKNCLIYQEDKHREGVSHLGKNKQQ